MEQHLEDYLFVSRYLGYEQRWDRESLLPFARALAAKRGWDQARVDAEMNAIIEASQRGGAQPRLVAHLPWAQGVGRSNRPAPTKPSNNLESIAVRRLVHLSADCWETVGPCRPGTSAKSRGTDLSQTLSALFAKPDGPHRSPAIDHRCSASMEGHSLRL